MVIYMKKAVFGFLLFCFANVVNAGVIWDNGTYDPNNYGANFSEASNRLADNFTLTTTDFIRSVQFWGGHWFTGAEPVTEVFNLYIYADNNGTVGSLAGTSLLSLFSKIDTGFNHNGSANGNILDFKMNLVNPIKLISGNYWFSVVSQNNPTTDFYWQETAGNSGNTKVSYNNGASWSNYAQTVAFNMSNAAYGQPAALNPVSAPHTAILFVLGLMGIFARQFKKA